MEILTSPKTSYLLKAGLDVLHYESKEWLSELEFLKGELRFFIKLLNSRVFTIGKDQQRQHILKNLDKLSASGIYELELEVKSHETHLSVLLTAKNGTDDTLYRTKHQQLLQKVGQLIIDMRTLKMNVFDFVEHLN